VRQNSGIESEADSHPLRQTRGGKLLVEQGVGLVEQA
jgi:hypothetical protein